MITMDNGAVYWMKMIYTHYCPDGVAVSMKDPAKCVSTPGCPGKCQVTEEPGNLKCSDCEMKWGTAPSAIEKQSLTNTQPAQTPTRASSTSATVSSLPKEKAPPKAENTANACSSASRADASLNSSEGRQSFYSWGGDGRRRLARSAHHPAFQ